MSRVTITGAPGVQLLSLERTATNITAAGTTQADVTGLDGTVTSTGRPLRVRWAFHAATNNTAGAGISLTAWESVGDTGSFTQLGVLAGIAGAAGSFCSSSAQTRDRPAQSVGTVTRYKVMVASTTGPSTTTLTCSATFPVTLSVEEV